MHIKTLVLDLDNTLINTPAPTEYVLTNNAKYLEYVFLFKSQICFKRPHLDEFLKWAAQHYNIVIWTAATKDYAKEIVNKLKIAPKMILSREHSDASYLVTGDLKNLKFMGLTDAIIVDDLEEVYNAQPANAYKIPPFTISNKNAFEDNELQILKNFLTCNNKRCRLV
jgi:TFIIF-interacting CTD phosphatase-like protein